MTTVINNPDNSGSGLSAVAIVMGIGVLLAAVALFVFYGLPAMNSSAPAAQEAAINVQVDVPDAMIPGPTAEGASGATAPEAE
jgi:hypothetical protein